MRTCSPRSKPGCPIAPASRSDSIACSMLALGAASIDEVLAFPVERA